MPKKIRISVGLTLEEHKQIELMANKLDVSISWLARKLIVEGIKPTMKNNKKFSIQRSINENKQ